MKLFKKRKTLLQEFKEKHPETSDFTIIELNCVVYEMKGLYDDAKTEKICDSKTDMREKCAKCWRQKVRRTKP